MKIKSRQQIFNKLVRLQCHRGTFDQANLQQIFITISIIVDVAFESQKKWFIMYVRHTYVQWLSVWVVTLCNHTHTNESNIHEVLQGTTVLSNRT